MLLTEKAQRYYDELPPHVKERKGAFYINELLKKIDGLMGLEEIINDMPENYPLIKDSGLWTLDTGEGLLLQQGLNESFEDFIKRCIESYGTDGFEI